MELTSDFNEREVAKADVTGLNFLIHGSVQVQRNSRGQLSILPEQYNFEHHTAAQRGGSEFMTFVRNVNTTAALWNATLETNLGTRLNDFTFYFFFWHRDSTTADHIAIVSLFHKSFRTTKCTNFNYRTINFDGFTLFNWF